MTQGLCHFKSHSCSFAEINKLQAVLSAHIFEEYLMCHEKSPDSLGAIGS